MSDNEHGSSSGLAVVGAEFEIQNMWNLRLLPRVSNEWVLRIVDFSHSVILRRGRSPRRLFESEQGSFQPQWFMPSFLIKPTNHAIMSELFGGEPTYMHQHSPTVFLDAVLSHRISIPSLLFVKIASPIHNVSPPPRPLLSFWDQTPPREILIRPKEGIPNYISPPPIKSKDDASISPSSPYPDPPNRNLPLLLHLHLRPAASKTKTHGAINPGAEQPYRHGTRKRGVRRRQ